MIYISTSAPIQYQIKPYDLYDSFDLVSQGKLQAPLSLEAGDFVRHFQFPFETTSIQKIYTAEDGQTFETAKLIKKIKNLSNVEIVRTVNLNGIRFSMQNLITKEEFVKDYNSAIIRARRMFVIKFFYDELLESRASIIKRMDAIRGEVGRMGILCISHSFYMRLLEIYVKAPEKFKNLDDLMREFNPENSPYKPLHGFFL